MSIRYLVMAAASVAAFAGCSRSNNLFLGRVEAVVAGHTVVVTDCYRPRVPQPVPEPGGARFTPCRDAAVVIHDGKLSVNRQPYGQLATDAKVVVDHGRVSIEPAVAH